MIAVCLTCALAELPTPDFPLAAFKCAWRPVRRQWPLLLGESTGLREVKSGRRGGSVFGHHNGQDCPHLSWRVGSWFIGEMGKEK